MDIGTTEKEGSGITKSDSFALSSSSQNISSEFNSTWDASFHTQGAFKVTMKVQKQTPTNPGPLLWSQQHQGMSLKEQRDAAELKKQRELLRITTASFGDSLINTAVALKNYFKPAPSVK